MTKPTTNAERVGDIIGAARVVWQETAWVLRLIEELGKKHRPRSVGMEAAIHALQLLDEAFREMEQRNAEAAKGGEVK